MTPKLRRDGGIVFRKYNINSETTYTTYVLKYKVLHTNKESN